MTGRQHPDAQVGRAGVCHGGAYLIDGLGDHHDGGTVRDLEVPGRAGGVVPGVGGEDGALADFRAQRDWIDGEGGHRDSPR